MVEINIEKKKKPVWPWILLLIIVGLIIWAIIEFTNDRTDTETAVLPATSGSLFMASVQPECIYRTVS
ncbi:hypothetical protein [Pontibacter populi]|uniref:HlyD family secretion protein n=1 Tax=Pontibacter populi TaxID=890055 RepID=A0ABV1RQL9_9BACT